MKQFKIFLSSIVVWGLAASIISAQYQQVIPPVGATTPTIIAAPIDEGHPATPYRWAEKIEKPGLPNLHKVSDVYYRGAQPDAGGFKELKALGIRTVINLRVFHSDKKENGGAGLGYEEISFKTWHPEDEDVIKFLQIVTDKSKQPIFVHCHHGADRTGMMTAIYRVAIQDWPKEEAIKEMRRGGFGFHEFWQNIVDYLEDLNIAQIKKDAGLKVEPALRNNPAQ